jgi:HSP20 family protein
MRRNPFDEIEEAIDRMSRQFEPGMAMPGDRIAVDVADRDAEYVVTADLPGYDTDDIDVTLDDGRLSIDVESQTEHSEGEDGDDFIFRERTRTALSRTVRLPEPVAEDDVAANYTNGVLTVTLPKVHADDDGGRSIDIE